MSEKDYVITKDGIFSRADVKEYVRPISSKEELTDLIERMPYITTINAPNGKARRDLYDITMEKYEDVEWVRVIKSVYLRMKDHKYEDYEPEYLNKAKEFLYGEISKQFGMDIEDVEQFVCSEVKRSLDDF